ncbi:MAG: TPM domain-containing protein [Isosphaeraceae bacterium]
MSCWKPTTRAAGLPAFVPFLVLVAAAGAARAQLPGPSTSAVVDRAGMFSAGAVEKANAVLREAERLSESHWEVVIETRPSLGGRDIATAAAAEAERRGVRGALVLIARDEKKLQVAPGDSSQYAFSAPVRGRIVEAFTQGLRRGDADAALREGVAEIRRASIGYGVRDEAKLFSREAVAKADEALEQLRASNGLRVIVETVPELKGQTPSAYALAASKRAEARGLYVLIAKKEHATWVEPVGAARDAFPPARTKPVNEALVQAFKAKEFDRGLADAVALVAKEAAARPPQTAAAGASRKSLTLNEPMNPVAPRPRLRSAGKTSNRVIQEGSPPAPRPDSPLVPGTSPMPIPPRRSEPAPTPAPAAEPAQTDGGSGLTTLLIVGAVVLGGLWAVSRFLRRPAVPEAPGAPPQHPEPLVHPSEPGYVPTPPPGPGYGPPPGPGYGYGYGAPAPAPAAGGGGVVSSVLGGMGGALLGNVLYDRFARPHDAPPEPPPHMYDAAAPLHTGWPQAGEPQNTDASAPTPPEETYRPSAGTGGDWSTPEPVAQARPEDWGIPTETETPEPAGTGGDWGTDDSPVAEADAGDWSTGGDTTDDATGGDWSTGSDEPDTGTGGDWSDGAGDDGTGDEQGSW